MLELKSIRRIFGITLVMLLATQVNQIASAQTAGGGGGGSTYSRGELFLTAGALGVSSGGTQLDIGPGFNFVPFQGMFWLELGAEMDYQRISYRAASGDNMLILAGVTANVGPLPREAVFISFGFAYRSGNMPTADSGSAEPNGNGFYFLAGKRIPITNSISLRPSLGMVSTGTSGMVFRPFSVSYMF